MASYKNTGLCVRNTFLSAETSSTSWCRSESSPPGGAIGNAGRKDRPALPVKSDEASALNNPSEPTVTTLMIGRLPPGTTSRSLAETVCGALAKVLCDFAFVAQDRTNSGELRNFRFGFLNFKDPAVAASILENGIPNTRFTVFPSREQGLDNNLRCYWGGVERRGFTGELTDEFRPLVMGATGWEAVEIPKMVQTARSKVQGTA
eukprot:CAMPEP_0204336606 /NCGR_PEP_ID=MMETSP0469-20131031/19670_1 /ASSEMBLY_ACC=CAM_ASM_000384 /TAXON_ID=2969 /ORGANISM="Oxyrrhis marina" /LENGTH=204 /DNA_ID=CAMNT_0051320505 /DNA_START=20 /DNA_END=634 /DNA_ORIENTATION=+